MSWGIETFGDNGNNYTTGRKFFYPLLTIERDIPQYGGGDYTYTIPPIYPKDVPFIPIVLMQTSTFIYPGVVQFLPDGGDHEIGFIDDGAGELVAWNQNTGEITIRFSRQNDTLDPIRISATVYGNY